MRIFWEHLFWRTTANKSKRLLLTVQWSCNQLIHDECFSNRIYCAHDVCFSKEAFLHTVYKVKWVNKNVYSVRFKPTCPIENNVKCFRLIRFSLDKFCKCQNLHSFFHEINFLQLPKYSRNLQMLNIIEKFENKNSFEKLVRPLVSEVEKSAGLWDGGTPSWITGTPLARYWHVGT